MAKSKSNRIIATPSTYAKKHYLYVQEVGSLESIEPHVSSRQNLNSYLFLSVTDGSGTLSYGNTHYPMHVGDCAWIDCRTSYAHESSIDEPWKLMWVHFNGEQAPFFYQHFIEQGNEHIFKPIHLAFFTECIDALYENQQRPSPMSELSSNKHLTDIITLCFSENKSQFMAKNSFFIKLEEVRSYIEIHFGEKISLDSLSQIFFISKFHLAREFKKIYGITIGNAITAKRISYAKSLLRFSEKPIDEISNSCGFQDAGYFIKVFKSSENMTPLEYRKKW